MSTDMRTKRAEAEAEVDRAQAAIEDAERELDAARAKLAAIKLCVECHDEPAEAWSRYCDPCRDEREGIPCDVSNRLACLRDDITRAVESHQNKGWDEGPMLAAIVEELQTIISQHDGSF